MSFVLNSANEQRFSLFDSYENLTEREKKLNAEIKEIVAREEKKYFVRKLTGLL